MISLSKTVLKEIYEKDYYLWLVQTLELVKNRNANELDWEHLTEEIEALGNEQRRKVKSYLRQLLIHLLLYRYWETEKTYSGRGWLEEISNFRYELQLLLESGTLYNYFLKNLDEVYIKARKRAIQKTKLSPSVFPEKCPFNLEEILKDD
ncbi:DUF29 domain-containing protein [Crocosphaera sp. Alani8]|uniref:DUF29 domain-containing protein n=1 Tax=Crocosphaera sp. Alani8 TaxID=3038952 RepID=UPI00313ED043